MKKLMIGGLAAALLYTAVPTLTVKRLPLGTYRKGGVPGTIALTFDDGPHPLYTPRLLDLLKQHEVKATFFVVGEKAVRFPELLRRIHEEGHEIAVHHYTHVSNWLLSPAGYRRQLEDSIRVISGITGVPPRYYRPPWGHLTPLTLLYSKKLGIVLWSSTAKDWKRGTTEKELFSRLKKADPDGGIILLHDSGDTFGADSEGPARLIPALARFIPEMKSEGVRFVPIPELLQNR
ncbi:polysaccharide deacetylase family protein [Indiicoccus explosivorum]|uniref:polysaccharide deacetylase family protein n=1 Tax=Indiicoccus explosivorum TaxID=1917864 RepID=UPI001F4D7CB1|nr:polysaccharide deacetylase family protein [Indiicoccus explosivorum]